MYKRFNLPFTIYNLHRFAFTLSEVLITLGIIGVVAAMTIPTIMNKANEVEQSSGVKKMVATLNQAFMQVVADNGGSVLGAYTDIQTFKEALKSKLLYAKDCNTTSDYGGSGSGASAEGCWHKANEWQYYGGDKLTNPIIGPGLILKDGSTLAIIFDTPNCDFDMTPYNRNYMRCGYINFDINGFKKPNTNGKDIYNINILPNRLVIEGGMSVDTTKVCVNTGLSSFQGWDCGAKYLQ